MSKTKYKTTSFAKFFVFMLVFLPIGYLGISFAKGHDIHSIKNSLVSKTEELRNGSLFKSNGSNQSIITQKDEEIQQLREELFQCQNKK